MWQWLFRTGDARNDWYLLLVGKQARPNGTVAFLSTMLTADAGAAAAVVAAVVVVAAAVAAAAAAVTAVA